MDRGPDSEIENDATMDFATFARQLMYDKTGGYSNNVYYTPLSRTESQEKPANLIEYENVLPDSAFEGFRRTQFTTGATNVTSLFLIDSKNRDRAAYPQPTSFTLKPPKVYKNVVTIQVTEIKLLSSFFYFRAAKGNTFLPVIERGREAINTFLGFPLTKSITIPEGTYNITDLLNALQLQMNYTPLFYDFPGYITGFVEAFTKNGDFSVNFNQPGDSYFDALNQKYITNPTMDQITLYYWGSRYAGLTQYTLDQIKVAYYFPVIYEALLDTNDTATQAKLNLTVPDGMLPMDESVETHIKFNSTGIDDHVILYLINNNIDILDDYRLHHTFRYFLVNRYKLSYDTNSLRVNFITLTLNTSLLNLLNANSASNLQGILQDKGFTAQSYSNVSNSLNQANVVFLDMYNYIQQQFTTYFAVGYATYANEYFLNTGNTVFVNNGLNAIDVRSNYTNEYLKSGISPISSATTYSNTPIYWPNFSSFSSIAFGAGGVSSEGINPSSSMIPYNTGSSNFLYGSKTIDPFYSSFIQTSRSLRTTDCVITIEPAKYTVFKFRSQARQTLRVETLPLPYYYRYADYNAQGLYQGPVDLSNNNMPEIYFTTPYSFIYQRNNSLMDSSNYSTFKLTHFSSFNVAFSNISTIISPLNVQSNYMQYEFVAAVPPHQTPTNLYAYNTKISFVPISSMTSNISTTFTTAATAFIYHDRGAFMADLATSFKRKENPLHFVVSTSVTSGQTDLTMNISTFSGQTYYTIFRTNTTSFPAMQFKPLVWMDSSPIQIKTDYVNFDPLGNPADDPTNYPFVVNYNTDYLRLPTQSTLSGFDPSNPIYFVSTAIKTYPIGYDISGVSDDLTDYRGYSNDQRGFVPNSVLRVDPYNQFIFQSLSPFDSNAYTYFGSNSSNTVLEPITNDLYAPKGSDKQEIKIVHWYDDYYIPGKLTQSTTIGVSPYVSSIHTVLTQSPSTFGLGINAIGFMPKDGFYDVLSFTFKSAIYPLSASTMTYEDPNSNIAYVGVFNGLSLANSNVQISNALTVLSSIGSRVYGPSTLSNTPGFGVELGTWYEYGYDASFKAPEDVQITGYTQAVIEMLSYDAMYYMVPFNADGLSMTFTNLTGSMVPYPINQRPVTQPTYFGQVAKTIPDTVAQSQYVWPFPKPGSGYTPEYGPQNGVFFTQSQYEQSQEITTNSFGYKYINPIVENDYALYPFNVTFSNAVNTIPTSQVGLTTFASEYLDKFYLVNSLSSYASVSNAPLTQKGNDYFLKLQSQIVSSNGNLSSIYYLSNAYSGNLSTIGNYPYLAANKFRSSILFESMTGDTSTITTRRIELDPTSPEAIVWLWGGGGGTWTGGQSADNNYPQSGGAGAYAQVKIDVQTLVSNYGVSTLYFVVGKGGNHSNMPFDSNTSQIQGYEQMRYGGGGTSILETNGTSPATDNITIQGGGFTGVFLDSNLKTALPLIMVGGGGAGGAYDMGGPGGFGLITPQPIIPKFTISTVECTSLVYTEIPIQSILDWDDIYNTGYYNTGTPKNTTSFMFDGNISTTQYTPRVSPYMQNGYGLCINSPVTDVYTDSASPPLIDKPCDIYRFNIQFQSNVSTIGKMEYYGSAKGTEYNTKPIGYVVYNSVDKSQILYSNTSFYWFTATKYVSAEYDQQRIVDELIFSNVRSNTVNNTDGWVTCGVGTSGSDTLQYSVDGSNWAPIRSQTGYGTPLKQTNAVVYANNGQWYACGSNVILRSSNGLDWTSVGDLSSVYKGVLNSLAVGSDKILASGTLDSGGVSMIYSTDGQTWLSISQLNSDITRIKYFGQLFWAISPSSYLYYSFNGVSWIQYRVAGIGVIDLIYTADRGQYVAILNSDANPFGSQIITGGGTSSIPPSTWRAANNFWLYPTTTITSIAYGNAVFVVGGYTADGSSPAKYSYNGVDWADTDVLPETRCTRANNADHVSGTTMISGIHLNMKINSASFNSNSGTFILVGRGANGSPDGFPYLPEYSIPYPNDNQVTILNSTDGVSWGLTFSGGYYGENKVGLYNPSYIPEIPSIQAYGVDYGSLSIIPDLSTMYIEIWKPTTDLMPIFELKCYEPGVALMPIDANHDVSNINDGNIVTYWQPSTIQAKSLSDYNFTLNFSTAISSLNTLTFYTSNDSNQYFTGLIISKVFDSSNVYNTPVISPSEFKYDTVEQKSYYQSFIIPPLNNVSTLFLKLIKPKNISTIQLNEIIVGNDSNYTKWSANSVIDLENNPADVNLSVSNIIDGNLMTVWHPNLSPWPGYDYIKTYKTQFTFSSNIPSINFIRIYNDTNNFSNFISGVVIYTDASKTTMLYSNDVGYNKYIQTDWPGENINGYHVIDCKITPAYNISQIYIELNKYVFAAYYASITINEVEFYNIGLTNVDTPAGYSGGNIATMRRDTVGPKSYEGGGGSTYNIGGGKGGKYSGLDLPLPSVTAVNGLDGKYLTGGSPASAGLSTTPQSFAGIIYGAGGGGGGYYGGGGGAINSGKDVVALTNQSNNGLYSDINWQSIASDSTGTRLVAIVNGGAIYTGINNNGVWTWTQQINAPSGVSWRSVASSSDGQKLVAVSDTNIYTGSYDGIDPYVMLWFQETNGLPTGVSWSGVASDSTGNNLTAVVSGGGIYTGIFDLNSQTFIWTQQTGGDLPLTNNWTSIASDSTGHRLAACAISDTIYTGSFDGTTWTWTKQTSGLPAFTNWYSIASDSTGTKLAAAAYYDAIYTGIFNGNTWTWTTQNTGIPGYPPWNSISSDSTGVNLAATLDGGGIYTATYNPFDGWLWTQTNSPYRYWRSTAFSSDGSRLAIAAASGSQTTGQSEYPGEIYTRELIREFTGGAGGGGSGFFSTYSTLVTVLDYGISVPGNSLTNTPSNYIPPSTILQDYLIGNGDLPAYTNTWGYGAGGIQAENSGKGAHGAILVEYYITGTVNPIGDLTATPKFINGDALTLFEAPINYDKAGRVLNFTAYNDPIQETALSNYNWVWYRSYLSLTGNILNFSTMSASPGIPSIPSQEFPNLPNLVYFTMEEQFSNVSSFFGGNPSSSNNILMGMQIGFNVFTDFFIHTSYTDSTYVEMTEIYCLLDYLKEPSNFLNPHIDGIRSPISRILGGVPRFGYWANPFLTNVSYVGFDTALSLTAPSPLSTIIQSSDPMQAYYGLAIEQSLSSGIYTLKEVMAFKPSGEVGARATQFPESYVVRNFSNYYLESNISVQPYTMKNGIEGKLPLFKYKVYTAPSLSNVTAPISMINDFQGQSIYFYSFKNSNADNYSSIHLNKLPFTSTTIQINNINTQGTVTSEYLNGLGSFSTTLETLTKFGFNNNILTDPYMPVIQYTSGGYNRVAPGSILDTSILGVAVKDSYGNLYAADRLGSALMYQNICTPTVYFKDFSKRPLAFASPSLILTNYLSGQENPYYDFFDSRFNNIWHFQGTSNLSTIYGLRFNSPYDFNVLTQFMNQVFFPTHKIVLTPKNIAVNPMTTNTDDMIKYPSYPRSQMFFYSNYTKLMQDIDNKFAVEKSSNFTYADTEFSGYFFNSFLNNINMDKSTSFDDNDANSFNYLAIRGYSPSESYKALVRFYLPGRYDFGSISLRDLNTEINTLQGDSNANSDYFYALSLFTSSFIFGSRIFGGTGLTNFKGSNISSVSFGDFLRQYSTIHSTIVTNSVTVSSVNGLVSEGQSNLILGDLRYILPSSVASRVRVYDPLEFKLPFSTIAQDSNRSIEEYGMGYNLGFVQADTSFNTAQRAGSFFKILDDYIFMKMNPELNMNRLDISRQENFAVTHDTQAESQLYNCKLMLNNFGTYATTLVQNTVTFNPPIGKLDKLSFSWYDTTGALIDNAECEWSGTIQIVESLEMTTASLAKQ